MDQKAAIPVSLPHPNPTTSYWQDPPDPELADYGSTAELPETADTVIIGSGISGACAAWNLLQAPNHGRLVMLEARQATSGATGRNGGHTKAASYRSFLGNAAKLGLDEAIQIARFEYRNIKSLQAFAHQHGIECDLFSGDTVDIFYDEEEWHAAKKAVLAIREAMLDEPASRYNFWDEQDVKVLFHCQGEKVFGGISYEAGSLSAYKFVTGVLKLCLKNGLQLFTYTPALQLQKHDEAWTIKTSKGTIRTKQVILATNAYTAFLHPKFQSSIVPLRGQITAQRPGNDIPKEGLEGTYSFIYAGGYEYMIPRPQGTTHAGDIIIGGGLAKLPFSGLSEYGTTDDSVLNPDISTYLHASTARYFGTSWGEDHEDGRVRSEWTGIMGFSPDGMPFVGEVPGEKGLWVTAGFQGHGMVLCFLCANALVTMMCGREEDLEGWFPGSFGVTEERLALRFLGRVH